ncbi:G-type lectin S-receptor-like serine/threonine-protein kinase At2g19130 [Olea europaea var. sylvestris]|uniref:G-type lectin S-receptor-like serine/threonine-protein kinase At2g19130 n=1 Tax=Olea europaea var. sylvestris TaxID=158386 RepID=UPI000C1CCD0E|nr:G-type lectin S-receptor-like serine/threonine-protein kinase At2g19130 [Olea europaea var. sylvestris]
MITKNTRCFIFSMLFFLCFYININLSLGGDSIRANKSLSGKQTIVSSGGTFELGFFKPGNVSWKARNCSEKVVKLFFARH